MRHLTLAVAAALIAAAPAPAAQLRVVSTHGHLPAKTAFVSRDAIMARSLMIARATWPDSPCTGRERVERGPSPPPGLPVPTDVSPGGLAWPTECVVWIRPGMGRVATCDVVVHELGHLAGREHDEHGVMRSEPEAFGPCVTAFVGTSV